MKKRGLIKLLAIVIIVLIIVFALSFIKLSGFITQKGSSNNNSTEPEPQAQSGEEICMKECVVKVCEDFDFECQNNNKANCEEECNLKVNTTSQFENKAVTNQDSVEPGHEKPGVIASVAEGVVNFFKNLF